MKQSTIIELLGDQPIAYHPILAKALKSVYAALFLSQLLYWQGRGRHGQWTYKSRDEWHEETGLTRRAQESARRTLVAAGVLEEDLRGVPATVHYRVNADKLAALVDRYADDDADGEPDDQPQQDVPASWSEPCQPDGTDRTNLPVQSVPTISETTQEITTENLSSKDLEYWERVREELRGKLQSAWYTLFVDRLRLGRLTAERIVIVAPDWQVKREMDGRLGLVVERVLERVAGRYLRVSYVVGGGP